MSIQCLVLLKKAPALHDRLTWHGLDISIENRPGTMRTGVDPDGAPWATLMLCPYGYIRRTNGLDDEQVDCFVGSRDDATMVYIVTTREPTDWRTIGEQKCMLNFGSAEEAKRCFLSHYPDPRHFSSMSVMPVDAFIQAVRATWDDETPRPLRGRALGSAV